VRLRFWGVQEPWGDGAVDDHEGAYRGHSHCVYF
jgi:hypothetical protein